jgi:hypothetical protein
VRRERLTVDDQAIRGGSRHAPAEDQGAHHRQRRTNSRTLLARQAGTPPVCSTCRRPLYITLILESGGTDGLRATVEAQRCAVLTRADVRRHHLSPSRDGRLDRGMHFE